jgi:hypothetical protein
LLTLNFFRISLLDSFRLSFLNSRFTSFFERVPLLSLSAFSHSARMNLG